MFGLLVADDIVASSVLVDNKLQHRRRQQPGTI